MRQPDTTCWRTSWRTRWRTGRQSPRSAGRPGGDAGFTLIEMVTAIGVFSIAAVGLLHVIGENARAGAHLRHATFAAVVADNQLAAAFDPAQPVSVGVTSGRARLAGLEWDWAQTVIPTSDPALVRISVQVRGAGEDRVAAEVASLRAVTP